MLASVGNQGVVLGGGVRRVSDVGLLERIGSCASLLPVHTVGRA